MQQPASPLTHVFGLHSVRWLALLSTVLALSRSFDGLAGDTQHAQPIQPDALLQSVARHTHYMPAHWRGRAHMRAVYHEFRAHYKYRVLLLLEEVLGAITVPLVMIFVLPQRAALILEFIRSFTVYVDGVGHVCSFALFDFERHGDARYGAPLSAVASMRSRDGKMEKAYVSFRVQHPSWRDAIGEKLLQNIGREDGCSRLCAASGAAGGLATTPGNAVSRGAEAACVAAVPSPEPRGAACTHVVPKSIVERSVTQSVRIATPRDASDGLAVSTHGGGGCAVSALGGTTMADSVSALGASGLQMLAQSSQVGSSMHQLMTVDEPLGGPGGLVASVSHPSAPGLPLAGAVNPFSVSAVAHLHAGAVSSDVRTQQLASLYSQLDQFFLEQRRWTQAEADVELRPV